MSENECFCNLINWQDLADYLENKNILAGKANSKPIQRRRGTASEHENFVGLDGEITIDTTNKTIRVHDGVTPGGNPLAKISDISENIPKIQLPENIDFDALAQLSTGLDTMDYVTATGISGTSWYRKHKSGWVEQGGIITGNARTNSGQITTSTLNLMVEMADTAYLNRTSLAMTSAGANWAAIGYRCATGTTTTLKMDVWANGAGETGATQFAVRISGYAK